MAVEVEMIVNGGMHGSEFLQTSHAPKPQHPPFSSSDRKMGVLSLIVQITSYLLLALIAKLLHRRTV